MKNIKMNLVMLGVGLMSVGALTSCGGSDANKKYAEDAITAISRLSQDFASVSGQIQAPHMISIPDEKDSNIRHNAIITWEYVENQWTTSVDEVENITYLTPTLPGADEAAVDFTITAIATVEKATARRTFEGTLLPTAVSDTKDIAYLYSAELTGETIVVEGVARDARTGNGYVVCDSTGCAYVYDRDRANSVVAGTTIRVTGLVGENPKTITVTNPDTTTTDYSVGCRQITEVSNMEVISTNKIDTIPQGSHIKDLTIEQHRAFVRDPSDPSFVNHAGEVYKAKGYLYKYAPGSYVTWELVNDVNNTSPYLSFYANTGNTTISDGLQGFYGALENQYVEATFMVYDINQSTNSGNVSWRNICLDIVATAAPTAA